MSDTDTAPEWLTRPQAAALLTVSVGTLRNWEAAGTGPRRAIFGTLVRYSREDINAFIRGSYAPGYFKGQKVTAAEFTRFVPKPDDAD